MTDRPTEEGVAMEAAGSSLRTLARSRPFVALWSSMFVSTVGTGLLLVALSVAYYQRSGQALAAGLVFAAQYLPLIVLMPIATRLCDRLPTRQLLVRLDLVSVVVSIGVGVAFGHAFWAVFLLLVARGFLEMTTKSARGVAIKTYLPAELVERGNTLLNSAYFLGSAAGGLIGGVVIGQVPVVVVAGLASVGFAVSAACCRALPLAPAPASAPAEGATTTGVWRRSLTVIGRDPELARALSYLVATVVLFQGVNQIARVWLPLTWLGMPANGAAWLEAVSVSGIVAGMVLVMLGLPGRWRLPVRVLFVLTAGLMLVPFATHSTVPAFASYFVYTMVFEIVYLMSFGVVLSRTAQPDLPAVMVLFYGVAFSGMTVTVLLVGALTDRYGLPTMLLVVAALALAMVVATERRARRHVPDPHVSAGQLRPTGRKPDLTAVSGAAVRVVAPASTRSGDTAVPRTPASPEQVGR
ncbi:MFS transporter [Micromonospora sp. NPDC050187]|uniref:MFS transporter n=1 Tax=Micromonospora sp. NPDC050187 TaxID=3364277 RepID=UPI0037A0B48D